MADGDDNAATDEDASDVSTVLFTLNDNDANDGNRSSGCCVILVPCTFDVNAEFVDEFITLVIVYFVSNVTKWVICGAIIFICFFFILLRSLACILFAFRFVCFSFRTFSHSLCVCVRSFFSCYIEFIYSNF